MSSGILVVISGPSGVGKGTVVGEVLKLSSNIRLSVSATTREQRPGEIGGKSYFFYTEDEFLRLANSGEMLEYARYCGNFYGTPRRFVEKSLDENTDVLLEIEVEGARQVKENLNDCVTIFLLPPSLEVLYNRLKGRGTETEDVLQNRIKRAREEILQARFYDYLIVNDNSEQCAKDVLGVISAEKFKFCRMKNYLERNFFSGNR